jgi:hypothetical protein
VQRERAARDEPGVERGDPRDRVALAQASQDGMRIALELLDGDVQAETTLTPWR